MGQGLSLKSEINNPWFKPWFNILLHKQSIVYATVCSQCLEYLGCITLYNGKKINQILKIYIVASAIKSYTAWS